MALPAALWLTALVAVIGAGALMIAGADLRFGVSAAERAQARHWAEGVAAFAALRLSEADPVYQSALASGQKLEIGHEEGRAEILVTRESDRLDLNAADPLAISTLLVELGMDRDRADRLAGAVADFRDPDDLTRLGGAEASAYADAGLDRGPLNRPFRTFEEVGLVLGFDRRVLDAIKARATVWGERPGPIEVEDLKPLLDRGEERGAALFWGGALAQGETGEGDDLGGEALRIDVSARVASGAAARATWIVLVDRRLAPPYRVLERL